LIIDKNISENFFSAEVEIRRMGTWTVKTFSSSDSSTSKQQITPFWRG
jgi:hypothetical protein